MRTFNCKVKQGRIVTVSPNKQKLLDRFLKEYESSGNTFILTVKSFSKRINEEQQKLFRAFLIKGTEVFGTDYKTMENELSHFFPSDRGNPIPLEQWNTEQLSDFINAASAYLIELDPTFKF